MAGMGLAETLIGVAVFSIVSLILAVLMIQSFSLWRRTSGRQSVEATLFKAQNWLARDLTVTAPDKVATQVSLSSSGVPDGDAVWFLSFVDPATGEPVYDSGFGTGNLGDPLWQRNILYYAVRPSGHDAHAGQSCSAGIGPHGYDDVCPHKMLVRKVIDGPNDANGREILLPSATPYLDRPVGMDVSGMGGSGMEEVSIAARDILTFHVTNGNPEVRIDLRATAIVEARKTTAIGSTSLSVKPNTLQRLFSVYPKNAPEVTP
jgi:hypothetical protein